jgi:hypothetical protein
MNKSAPMDTNSAEVTIHDLYPDLSSEQQAEAVECLSRYIDLVCRIYERNENLTKMDQDATI